MDSNEVSSPYPDVKNKKKRKKIKNIERDTNNDTAARMIKCDMAAVNTAEEAVAAKNQIMDSVEKIYTGDNHNTNIEEVEDMQTTDMPSLYPEGEMQRQSKISKILAKFENRKEAKSKQEVHFNNMI